MEILAPAGNIEIFEKIIDYADAVYCGLKNFNARLRARNFSFDELAAAVKYSHQKNKKVYVTLNTLIKEIEIPKTIEILQFLNEIKIDAVIIQDLAILKIIKEYFPKLAIHSSTQMFFADRYSAKFGESNKISRIILPRELNLEELQKLDKQITNIELEIFAFGAMCYSISGHCLMSYFIGGQSANRGMCAQPCRRKFKIKNPDISSADTYFSLADLCIIDFLPELLKLQNLKALKIEGRLKPAEILIPIIKSFKTIISAIFKNDENLNKLIADKKKQLSELNSRPLAPGYINFSRNFNIAFSEQQHDNYILAGKIIKIFEKNIYFRAFLKFNKNSKFKLEHNNKRNSLTIYKITDLQNNEISEAQENTEVIIYTNSKIKINDAIYVLKNYNLNNDNCKNKDKIKIEKFNFQLDRGLLNKILLFKKNNIRCCEKRYLSKQSKKYYYVNEKNLTALSTSFFKKNNIILEFDISTTSQSNFNWKTLTNKNCIIALPLLLDNSQITKKILEFKERGYNNFMIAHISQLELLKEIINGNFNVYANHTLHITNSLSAKFLENLGFKGFVFDFENELKNIETIMSDLEKFVFIKYQPHLFYSRAINKKLDLSAKYIDEYNKTYSLKTINNLFAVIPEKPVSLETHTKFFQDNNINIIYEI
ncbi:MAG TPA: peptidase U32 family protein [bacterium]|nr:peptidase U32 family protein [bacterium]